MMNQLLLIVLLLVAFTCVSACSLSNNQSCNQLTFVDQSINHSINLSIHQPAPVFTNISGCAVGLTQCVSGDRLTILGSYLSDPANGTQVTFARYYCIVTDQSDEIVHCTLPAIPAYDHGAVIPLFMKIDNVMWSTDRDIQYAVLSKRSSSSSSSSSTGDHSPSGSDEPPLNLALGLVFAGVIVFILSLIICVRRCRSRGGADNGSLDAGRVDRSAPLLSSASSSIAHGSDHSSPTISSQSPNVAKE